MNNIDYKKVKAWPFQEAIKLKNKVSKIHLRSFTSRKSCWVFKQILKRRFNKFSNKKLTIRTNIRGTKIQYFCGGKI